jgi:DNA-binding CsgD family transcriptional regulator/tetratricopeptide (TPR) repeat protein
VLDMLYGRRKERGQIGALLEGARGGQSGVLVVRGEAGIGKHALLADAVGQATGFRLLHTSGVEAEVGLAFAGLQRLLGPVLDRLDRLPAPQAEALRAAFGLVQTRTETNRFLVELGVLSLLGVAAGEQPLLCWISEVCWLDAASADALVFVARRLQREPIVLLFAAQEGQVRRFVAPGLPELHLRGLDAKAAAELLGSRVGPLAPQVRDRLIGESGGNPLALLELPAPLTSQQLAGRELLPEPLPLTARLQQVFLQRFQELPQATQTLLLVAAAEGAGELATISAAGQLLAVELAALTPAEEAGLVQVSDFHLRFRHPLVRLAIYQDATFAARQAAHRVLLQVLGAAEQADRRVWHLAATTLGPDEQVAAELEASADRDWRRGGPAAAAATLQRAAALSPPDGPRTRRLVAAAEYLWEAGHTTQATALLNQVEPGSADLAVRARAAHVRGHIELASGSPATACRLLVGGAKLLGGSDPRRATEMLVLAARAALSANQLGRIVDEINPAIRRLPGQQDVRVQRVADSLGAAGLVPGPPAATTMDWPLEVATGWPHPAFTWMWPMLIVAEPTDDDGAGQPYAGAVAARRTAGTVSRLTVALANLALAEAALGLWPDAVGDASEGLRLARDTGQPATAAYFLVMLAALAANQGQAEDCRQLSNEALATATRLHLVVVAAFASWTLALLELTEGRPLAALERLRGLATLGHPTAHAAIALLATGTLVEAAARANQLRGLESDVARFERWARVDRRTWTQLVAHRCRAQITHGPAAEQHYRAALAVEGAGELVWECARTELLYGEWLRRARRRADARGHLRAALGVFERLGAAPWAERARSELRASGQTARKRDPSTRQQITPQERQVARLASQGLSNQQIADQLFVSRHTVGYHLHKLYTKLGVTSRAELRDVNLEDTERH